ncbi:MAG: hypothetical protein EOO59_19560 [Hymenobacter sp.]|nr:MAG: hypothetical protein EOO59_19560 [Hymenobacter sp.]
MAELRIQPKKSAPSPWLLVALAVLVLAAAAYFFLRTDPADEPAAPQTELSQPPVPADSLARDSSGASATPPPVSAADSVTSASAGESRAAE